MTKTQQHDTRDTFGGRCAFTDPVIETRTYGGPGDYFKVIFETTVTEHGVSRIDRRIVPNVPKPKREAAR